MSSCEVGLDVSQLHRGMMVALPVAEWALFRRMTAVQLATIPRQMAEGIDLRRYQKTKRGPKKKPPAHKVYRNGGSVVTYRLLQKRTR